MFVLVAAVAALTESVAKSAHRYASVVFAAESSGRTDVREAAGLVRAVLAVVLSVALPVAVDT